jgi:TolA-binding protein
VQARLARGRWAQGTPRWEEAAKDLRSMASERAGTSMGVQAEMILAEGAIAADPAAARAKALELATRFPEAAGSSRRVIALSYLHEKNYPAAARTFGDEVRFEDKDPVAKKSAMWNRAECYFFGNVMDSANIGYKAVALQYLNDRLGHEALERMLLLADAADDGEEALKDFAAAASPAGREGARADSALQKVYSKYPRKVAGLEALFQSAEIHRKRGDVAEALRMYTILADTSLGASRAQDALFQAAEIQRTRLSQPRRALDLYSELVTRYPDSWLAPEARRWVDALKKEVGS